MFCLKIDTPLYRVLEFFTRFFQEIYGFRIGHAAELRIDYVVEPFYQSLVYEAIKKVHLLGSVFENVIDDILYHVLSQPHIVLQVCECDLRLYHPELGSVSGRIRILGSERRPEGIYVSESESVCLRFQLSAYSHIGLFAKKVFAVIYFAVFRLRRLVHIQRGDSEHFTCSLSVASCYYRGMHVYEVLFLEELVYRVRYQRSDSENCGKGVASRSQMSYLPEEFHGVPLGLKRIVRRGSRFYSDFFSFYLKGLFCARSKGYDASHIKSGGHVCL